MEQSPIPGRFTPRMIVTTVEDHLSAGCRCGVTLRGGDCPLATALAATPDQWVSPIVDVWTTTVDAGSHRPLL